MANGRALRSLGIRITSEVMRLIDRGAEPTGTRLSLERADLLDVDLLVWLDATRGEEPLANRLYRRLDVRREGREAPPDSDGRLGGASFDGRPRSVRRVDLRPAADLLRDAAMSTGEWSAADPGGRPARSLRWRVEAEPSVPLLAGGCRHGDPPVLVVPAGGAAPVPTAADLAATVAPGDERCQGLLVRAIRSRRLTVAEIVLGPEPLVTAVRRVRLDRPSALPPGAGPGHDQPAEWSSRIIPTQGPDRR